MFFVKQQNQNLHRSSISLYFPNLEEFRFITVVAFPKDSKIGFAMMILSWIRDPCAASVPQWWTNSNRQKYFEFCSRDAYIHRERERYIYTYKCSHMHTYACIVFGLIYFLSSRLIGFTTFLISLALVDEKLRIIGQTPSHVRFFIRTPSRNPWFLTCPVQFGGILY